MRLTLRTLLAYLDDVLDPADKEELGKKIESSDFAGDLILRMRDTMRRLRLSAPQVVGTGMGLDPNTVAEYLDNALPPDQVGDFERICLESDMHLAEVASSHHVLTMVLGAPAEVDSSTKARMYSIPQEARERRHLRVEPAHAGTIVTTVRPPTPVSAILATVPPGSASAATSVATTEVPEYLRAGGWSGSRAVLIGIAALFLLGATIVLVAGLGDWFGEASETVAVDTATKSETGAAGEANEASPVEDTAAESAIAASTGGNEQSTVEVDVQGAAAPAGAGTDSLASPPTPYTPGITAPALPAPPPAGDPYAVTTESPASSTAATTTTSPLLPPTSPAGAPATVVDDSSASTLPPASGGAEPMEAPPAEAVVGSRYADVPVGSTDTVANSEEAIAVGSAISPSVTPLTSETAGPNDPGNVDPGAVTIPANADAAATEIEPDDTAVADLGTYLPGKTVLLRWNDAEGGWFRVAPRSGIVSGDQLISLPEFRSQLTLASGVHLDLSGGTRIKIEKVDANAEGNLAEGNLPDGTPAIDVLYGRIVLWNTANGTNPIRLQFGKSSAGVELQRNATLGVEVTRRFVPGRDPRKSESPLIVSVFAPDGGVVWRDAAGEKTIDEPSSWTIAGGEMSEISNNPEHPEWIDDEPIEKRSERIYGAPEIEKSLTTNRPVDNQLLELFLDGERKRKEVKSLAARSSIHVGLFVPFVDALRDSQQRPNWEKHIETLRSAMALDPQAADSIWDTLVDKRGEAAAADLYEMLCGYSAEQIGRTPQQVRSGAIADLIDRLESDSLDYRVLAVHNLAEITGKRLMNNPAAGLTERALNVRRWRLRLEDDELVPREAE